MFEAVKRSVARADIYIGVAAVADYRVDKPRRHKIKKTGRDQLHLKLVPNPDILGWVAARSKPPFCVGFAAESRDLDANAEEKRRSKKVPLMVANLAQQAIGADDNEVPCWTTRECTSSLARPSTCCAENSSLPHCQALRCPEEN